MLLLQASHLIGKEHWDQAFLGLLRTCEEQRKSLDLAVGLLLEVAESLTLEALLL